MGFSIWNKIFGLTTLVGLFCFWRDGFPAFVVFVKGLLSGQVFGSRF